MKSRKDYDSEEGMVVSLHVVEVTCRLSSLPVSESGREHVPSATSSVALRISSTLYVSINVDGSTSNS